MKRLITLIVVLALTFTLLVHYSAQNVRRAMRYRRPEVQELQW